jgi:hypothetical protein
MTIIVEFNEMNVIWRMTGKVPFIFNNKTECIICLPPIRWERSLHLNALIFFTA